MESRSIQTRSIFPFPSERSLAYRRGIDAQAMVPPPSFSEGVYVQWYSIYEATRAIFTCELAASRDHLVDLWGDDGPHAVLHAYVQSGTVGSQGIVWSVRCPSLCAHVDLFVTSGDLHRDI